jgi:hypothetical protein
LISNGLQRCGLDAPALSFALMLASGPAARGGVFVGDPTGKTSAKDSEGSCTWESTLNPVPAVLETGQDADLNAAVIGAIDKAGFNAANGWTVATKGLNGSFTLDTYYAWVTDQPSITRGGITSTGNDHGEIGGAAFVLGFDRAQGDPPAADTHWMQIVLTDQPGLGGFDASGAYDGYRALVDNNGSTTDPTYDGNGGSANADVFIDVPHDVCPPGCNYSASWRFLTLIVTDDTVNKSLTVYTKGVEWGYDFSCTPVPEPPTLAGALMAGLTGLGYACRRRARAAG